MSATSVPPATTGSDPFVPRNDPPTSPWLAALLNNAKNRDTLARLESGLITFMHDRDKVHLELPPCNRFKRRVYVEVAQRFRLEHRLDRPPDATDPDAVLLVLLKSPQSAIPTTMLSSLMPPNEKPVLVKRPTGRPRANGDGPTGSCTAGNASAALKKVSQEEYEQARARIFRASGGGASGAVGTGANTTTRGSVDVLAPSSSGGTSAAGCKLSAGGLLSASSSVSSGAPSNPDSAEHVTNVNVRIVGGGVARGPEEGKSFARRRGRSGNGTTNGGRSSILDHRMDSSVNAGSKASCGTEGADKDDPDFDRRYDKWAVRSQAAGPLPQQHPPLLYGVPPPPSTMYPYAMHHHRAMSHAEAHAHAAAQAQFPLQMYHMAAAAAAQPPPPPPPYFAQASPTMTNSATTANGARFTATSSSLQHIAAAATPSYGLDNATDFPPLSAKGGGGANSKHRR